MALPTPNPPLPALEDLITLTPRRPSPKRSARGPPATSDATVTELTGLESPGSL
jgi:hypothetical protein